MPPGNKRERRITALLVKKIPSLLTFGNMLLGLTVLYLNIGKKDGDYLVLSCILILVAAVLDAFDGVTARLLGAESDFGKEFDSFADLISFGLAPMGVLLTVEAIAARPAILILLALYPVAGVFRLVRFNLGNSSGYFTGLPITAAGFIQACFILLVNGVDFPAQWVARSAALLTAVLSLLMVSAFRVRRPRLWQKERP